MKCPNCKSDVWYFGLHMDVWCKNIFCKFHRNENGKYFWFTIPEKLTESITVASQFLNPNNFYIYDKNILYKDNKFNIDEYMKMCTMIIELEKLLFPKYNEEQITQMVNADIEATIEWHKRKESGYY